MVTPGRWHVADCVKSATQREGVKASCSCVRARPGSVGVGLACREWP